MDYLFITAQICGLAEFTAYGISTWLKNKKDMLFFQIIGTLESVIRT